MICLYVNFWNFWLIPFRFMMKKDHSKEKCYLGFNSPLSIFGYNFVIFEHNFVILKFYCFILPLNLIPLWALYSFFGGIIQVWQQYFTYISSSCLDMPMPILGQFLGKNLLYMYCSGSACYDCTSDSGSSLVVYGNVLVFYFPFSQFPTIISSSCFRKTSDFSGNSWSVAPCLLL